jgi:hypothetical protein
MGYQNFQEPLSCCIGAKVWCAGWAIPNWFNMIFSFEFPRIPDKLFCICFSATIGPNFLFVHYYRFTLLSQWLFAWGEWWNCRKTWALRLLVSRSMIEDIYLALSPSTEAVGGEHPRSATWAPSCASFPCPVVGVSCTQFRKPMQVGAHTILKSSKMLFIDFEGRWHIHTVSISIVC